MSITRKKLDSLGRETDKAEPLYKRHTTNDISNKNVSKKPEEFDETQRHLLENLSKIKDEPNMKAKKKPWWKFW